MQEKDQNSEVFSKENNTIPKQIPSTVYTLESTIQVPITNFTKKRIFWLVNFWFLFTLILFCIILLPISLVLAINSEDVLLLKMSSKALLWTYTIINVVITVFVFYRFVSLWIIASKMHKKHTLDIHNKKLGIKATLWPFIKYNKLIS
ncbi:Uncharacterised protein (plasmid) [Mesomycoplasma conjunctivae]|uniref:Uncharacterized protein n=1 Tax=Mycoplasmopsis fermentans (strain M64) TaxID=943945 RepID=A0AB32XBM1_MYCFM|nr:hypothetical protein [Mycoplasmopsis fermentans]VEU66668.1 Uncharacterised protein [Mesomycoplasma conjunctivae]ADV34119.1 Hypothetical Protein MfeM64YM_0110 [Mycoplasmopsis fermentans M64]ADV34246.1 Hypothetical Protein MfeM64YM_0240 [Mycoplasmopsis fermentans M64]ADV34470.1 Hypothetical Protein MfeM64YM_0472 [Mycoplasmopsis fermentans M64]VEU60146.1 Uncharacterised protein [Mycoplasmopsis fermentans]